MAISRREESHSTLPSFHLLALGLFLIAVWFPYRLPAQEGTDQVASPQQERDNPEAITSLRDLLTEAEQNNPQISAARQTWEAAKQVPSQVSTLPDPQFVIQQFNVGSPRPFAGYTNSDFAYFGLGISQDIPYPGKLHLRGEIAERDSDIAQEQCESVRRAVLADVKSAYFQLAYLARALRILESDGQLLEQVEKAADARYRSGMGSQQDLLQAQLEQTKLLREITMHHLDVAKAQAHIKQLLNRSQSSPDIEPGDLPDTPIDQSFDELLDAAKNHNPDISGSQQMVEKQKLQVDIANKDFDPDFNIQYMWQRTDPTQYRAYYMLSVGVTVPIYRSRKQRHELAQAEANLARSRSEAESQTGQIAFQLRTAFDTVEKAAEMLKIYKEGLLPQAQAEFQSGLAAYQNNRAEFQSPFTSFLDVLSMDEEYWQTVGDRETAIAQIEQLTGLSLRQEGSDQ
ncbi:MAG: TolC family protein [Candidatus Acidiferrales bacterium]